METIAPGRGSKYLYDVLGKDFEGPLCSESFLAYLKFFKDNARLEPHYCWAHLIRDLRHVAQTGDRASRRWTQKLLEPVKRLFGAWHRGWYKACDRGLDRVLKACERPGVGRQARTLGKRMYKQRRGHGRFLKNPASGIEPTNNAAERELRKRVLHRWDARHPQHLVQTVVGTGVQRACDLPQAESLDLPLPRQTFNACANGVSLPMLV